jgi:DNA polymerase-3 subunit delta'
VKLVLADETCRFLKRYEAALPQAVLLSGPRGVGLHTIARFAARSAGTLLADLEPQKASKTALPAISVERIRNLYETARIKPDRPHFIVIDDAERMNTAAQNAFLKLLEEPNDHIHFILTSHQPDALLPTVRSRLQAYHAPAVTPLDSHRLLTALGIRDDTTEKRLLYIASGLPAELTRLAGSQNQDGMKKLAQRVTLSRQLVEGSRYERLVSAHTLSDDRAAALDVIATALHILRRSLTASPDRLTAERIARLMAAEEAIRANGNLRLQLAEAVV